MSQFVATAVELFDGELVEASPPPRRQRKLSTSETPQASRPEASLTDTLYHRKGLSYGKSNR